MQNENITTISKGYMISNAQLVALNHVWGYGDCTL